MSDMFPKGVGFVVLAMAVGLMLAGAGILALLRIPL